MEELHGQSLAEVVAKLTNLRKTTKWQAYRCLVCGCPAVYANSTLGFTQ
jgi:hypothetical protein